MSHFSLESRTKNIKISLDGVAFGNQLILGFYWIFSTFSISLVHFIQFIGNAKIVVICYRDSFDLYLILYIESFLGFHDIYLAKMLFMVDFSFPAHFYPCQTIIHATPTQIMCFGIRCAYWVPLIPLWHLVNLLTLIYLRIKE